MFLVFFAKYESSPRLWGRTQKPKNQEFYTCFEINLPLLSVYLVCLRSLYRNDNALQA